MRRGSTRLVLFDVDGTLIDAYGAGRKALEEAFEAVFGKPEIARHLDSVWFAGKTDLFIFREVAMRAGVTSWEYERRYLELESCYLDRLRGTVAGHAEKRILPGIAQLLESLSARHDLSLGLMTGNLEAGARVKLEPWGLNRFFPTGGFGSDALDRSEIGIVAHERFERRLAAPIARDEVVLVGDTLHDISAARACGFRVLAVGTGWAHAPDLIGASPDSFLTDLSDRPSALAALGL